MTPSSPAEHSRWQLGARSALRPELRPCLRLPAAPAAPTRTPTQAEPQPLGYVTRRP